MDLEIVSLSTMKGICLVLLVSTNVFTNLLMRYIRTRPNSMFFATSQVFLVEVLKFFASLVILFWDKRSWSGFKQALYDDVYASPRNAFLLSVPAFLYVLQNNLYIVGITYLDVAVVQILLQFRLLTTAVCFRIMLNKTLNRLQWLAISTLFLGMVLAQGGNLSFASRERANANASATVYPLVGVGAIFCNSVLSGFTGVYMERMLKVHAINLWIQNVVLSFLSIFIALATCFIKDGSAIRDSYAAGEGGLLHGYTEVVWFSVVLQALGGISVALVIKYTDNIIKSFALSAAIVLSMTASIYVFDFQPSLAFAGGSLLICLSIFAYSIWSPSSSSSSVVVSQPVALSSPNKRFMIISDSHRGSQDKLILSEEGEILADDALPDDAKEPENKVQHVNQ